MRNKNCEWNDVRYQGVVYTIMFRFIFLRVNHPLWNCINTCQPSVTAFELPGHILLDRNMMTSSVKIIKNPRCFIGRFRNIVVFQRNFIMGWPSLNRIIATVISWLCLDKKFSAYLIRWWKLYMGLKTHQHTEVFNVINLTFIWRLFNSIWKVRIDGIPIVHHPVNLWKSLNVSIPSSPRCQKKWNVLNWTQKSTDENVKKI